MKNITQGFTGFCRLLAHAWQAEISARASSRRRLVGLTLGGGSLGRLRRWPLLLALSLATAVIARAVAPYPDPPTNVTAIGMSSRASVSFTPPVFNGGTAITSYAVTAADLDGSGSSFTASGPSSPITVTGLINGHTYEISVTSTNSAGAGDPSNWPAGSYVQGPVVVIGAWATGFDLGGTYTGAEVTCSTVDASGNTYLAGTIGTKVTGSATNKLGTMDAFVVKYDAAGTVLWAKNYGGVGAYANFSGIAVDSAGSVYLTGSFSGANLTQPALTKIGAQDLWVLKLAATGTTVWAKNFGGAAALAAGEGIAVDATGSMVICGFFSTANLTTPALTKLGAQDALVLKLSSAGAATWAKNYGGSAATYAYGKSIAVDTSANVYLSGYFNGANLTTPALTKIGAVDLYVMKLSSAGATTWSKNYGGVGASALANRRCLAVDASANVYLSGYFYGANLTTPALSKIGSTDLFALKLTTAGVTTWSKNFGGSAASITAAGLAVDGAGNVYLGGDFVGDLTTPALPWSASRRAALALKLSSAGAVTWYSAYGGTTAQTHGVGLNVDSAGNVLVGGYFSGTSSDTNADLPWPTYSKGASMLSALILKESAPFVAYQPTNVVAIGGVSQATVSGTAPVDNGGPAITGYTVTAKQVVGGSASFTRSFPSLPAVWSDLPWDKRYAFTVAAVTDAGIGKPAAVANAWVGDWGKAFGSKSTITATATDSLGNVYLAGSFTSASIPVGAITISKYGVLAATQAAFVAKMDSTGTVLWAKGYGGAGCAATFRGLIVDGSGNVYLCGDYSLAAFGGSNFWFTKQGTRDAFVLKLGADGTDVWQKNYGGAGTQAYANALAVDSAGSVYLAGSFDHAMTTPALSLLGVTDALC